jgi:glutamate 5-kinase
MYDGKQIGVGRVAYDSDKARAMIGKRGTKYMIHYDYLYLEQ